VPISQLAAPVVTNAGQSASCCFRRGRAGGEMEAACAENRKRGFAMAGSVTKIAIFLHGRQ